MSLAALDPRRSVVVEACAGSGKTWLLVSRMLRLLLAGAPPSELLAITFTRKAAEEMRARLYEWLAELALADDAAALDFLVQRGLDPAEAAALLPRARGLHEAVLASRPGPLITTFHGWFLNLLQCAPLGARAPANLIESVALLREEAWLTWTEGLAAPTPTPDIDALRALLAELPLDSVRRLVFAVLDKRVEWWAWRDGQAAAADPAAANIDALAALTGVAADTDVVAALCDAPDFRAALAEFLPLLQKNAVGFQADVARAESLAALLADWPAPAAAWRVLPGLFLTQGTGEPLSRKPGKALSARLGDAAERFLQLHQACAERIQAVRVRLEEQNALRLHRLALTAGLGLLARYQALKAVRDGLDFSDAEYRVARLLADAELAGAVLAKLDARWKHLLLDEFQDANPLQWQILLAWLSAYGADPERPTVFLVGDPKQSIYRFRRAEAALFSAAAAHLERDYGALRLGQNETRRCAPRVVAWVNAVFEPLAADAYAGYHRHSAVRPDLAGACEILSAPEASTPAVAAAAAGRLRDPLTEPPPAAPEKRAEEARQVAARIRELVGRLRIDTPAGPRAAGYADILVLAARRTDLAVFEAAFKAAGVPFVGSRRGGLLDTLEARDLVALLKALVDPGDDLSLAHALKSPLFGCADADLQRLAAGVDGPWSQRLAAWAATAEAPPHIRRAADLLADWRAAAGHLPPHDLLDRVFHAGALEARYAAALPEHLRAGGLANLRALLSWSLKLSGGRFPSLPRFIDELAELRRRAGDEAPDEAPASAGDVVRMLTIHAAKGLEAPVVFLIKADETPREQQHYGALIDWPATAAHPAHFSIHGSKGWCGRARDALFAREQAAAAREQLNLLYVAMTRARQLLIVSGLDTAKPESWLARLQTALTDAGAEIAAAGPALEYAEGAAVVAVLEHAPHPAAAPVSVPSVGSRRAPETAETIFGIQVHRYLELVTAGRAPAAIAAELGLTGAAFAAVEAAARSCLTHPQARRFFAPGYRAAHNELEFIDADGVVGRIDRLVEFDDAVWLLDYKTGGHAEADLARRAEPHVAQLDAYRRAARALYPGKPVHAALLFSDGAFFELAPD